MDSLFCSIAHSVFYRKLANVTYQVSIYYLGDGGLIDAANLTDGGIFWDGSLQP